MQDFDVYLVIDEDGNHAAGSSRDLALQQYADDIGYELGAGDGQKAYRIVRVPVRANLPGVVELPTVTVPDED